MDPFWSYVLTIYTVAVVGLMVGLVIITWR